MSDGRSGSVLTSKVTPAALQRPYDGGPAFTNTAVGTTRFSHMPNYTGQPHLQDKIRIETTAEPPAIGNRSTIGTTRVGARGKVKQFHGSADQHVSGSFDNTTLSNFLGVQANDQPDPRCIQGSNRKRFDWVRGAPDQTALSLRAPAAVLAAPFALRLRRGAGGVHRSPVALPLFGLQNESYGMGSAETLPRGKAMNSINGRSVYARDSYSVPMKGPVQQPDRQPRKGPSAHLVTLANGGEVEDLGRRHYDQANPPNRVPDVAKQRGKFADFPIKPTTESDQGKVGKMGEYSVFDMIGRKREDPGKWSENANHWPATKEYGPSYDKEGFPIDYSITEHGGPFRRPTIYHNDYRLEKRSTYGEVLPPGHSEEWGPGTSDSVVRAQGVPQRTNVLTAGGTHMGTPLVGAAPELAATRPGPGVEAPAPVPAPSAPSSVRQPPPLAERLQPRAQSTEMSAPRTTGGDSGLFIPEIYFGSEYKSYNKGASMTHSCVSRAGTPPTQEAPRAEVVRYKATEDGNHRKRSTHTGIFRP